MGQSVQVATKPPTDLPEHNCVFLMVDYLGVIFHSFNKYSLKNLFSVTYASEGRS